MAATVVPGRGVFIAGSFDHLFGLRSKDCTASITLVGLSPPTATSCPATIAAPSPPAGGGIFGRSFQRSRPGSQRSSAATFLSADTARPPTAYRYLPSDAAARWSRWVGM